MVYKEIYKLHCKLILGNLNDITNYIVINFKKSFIWYIKKFTNYIVSYFKKS